MKAVNELEIYAQAVWRFGVRTLAASFGLHNESWGKKKRVKCQARYHRAMKKPAALHAQAPQKQARQNDAAVKQVSKESLPVGTLTEIRSIAYLDGQARDLQQDLQQGLKQMLPALAGFCQQRWLVLVAPPCLPSAGELSAAGIDPTRVLLVHPGAQNGLDILEQTLRSGTCGAVLAWLEKGDTQTLDRLRLAAEAGNAWGVLFRATKQGKQVRVPASQMTEAAQLKMAMN